MNDLVEPEKKIKRRFTGTYKYPEWFSKEKYIICEAMLERLNKLVWVHSQSSEYYEKRHFRIFFPNITITAISGIASFLSTSQFIDDDTQTAFGITVGVLASVSALVQSVASVTRYSAKAEAHQTAADEYSKLLTRLKFEIEMPNEKDFLDNLEKSILEIQNKCNYFPPQFISTRYYKMKIKSAKYKKEMDKIYNKTKLKSMASGNYGSFSSLGEDSRDHVSITIEPDNTETEHVKTKSLSTPVTPSASASDV